MHKGIKASLQKRFFGFCGPLFVAALSTACTQVTIYQADGEVTIERTAGIVSIDMSPATEAQLLEVEGVGAMSFRSDFAIGYYNASGAMLPPDDCRLVIWFESVEQIERFRSLLQKDMTLCSVSLVSEGWQTQGS